MKQILIAILLVFAINTQTAPSYNSHQVNQKLTEHKNSLETHNSAVNTLTTAGNKVHDTINNVKSTHVTELQSIQDKLQEARKASSSTDFTKLVDEYNALVNTYNTNKKTLYCPDLINLNNARPVPPTDPTFQCEHVANLCAKYTAYTYVLQKIFNPTTFDGTNSEDPLNEKSKCLLDEIKTKIIEEPGSESTEEKPKRTPVETQLSFQAKCCTQAAQKFAVDNFNTIKTNADSSTFNINILSYPDSYTITTADAQTEIQKAIEQIKSSLKVVASKVPTTSSGTNPGGDTEAVTGGTTFG